MPTTRTTSMTSLGSAAFREDYGLRLAYVQGAMVKGIASVPLVIRLGRGGCLGFFGSGGVPLAQVEEAVRAIQQELGVDGPYGVNVLASHGHANEELAFVDALLRLGVRNIEASAFMQSAPSLVKFRLRGARMGSKGPEVARRIVAKVSRPEVAKVFLAPPAEGIVARLLQEGQLNDEEAACAPHVPLASDLCVEADSGGHTDGGNLAVLLPSMIRLRDALQEHHRFRAPVRVGAAGGLGAPEQVACAFFLGADFITTGSINQCTPEAGTSDAVKDMLQNVGVQDTAYAPAGDMFEMGAKVQVMKKGVFFPARANKLYDLWRQHASLDALEGAVRREIQDKFFRRSFEDVWAETRDHYGRVLPAELARVEGNPKAKMGLVFRWYFVHSMRLALRGESTQRVDYQVHCGPAMGAFNQWVQGTSLEDWRRRHGDTVAEHLMQGACDYLHLRQRQLV